MADPAHPGSDGAADEVPGRIAPLRHLRAAQLRARVVRGGLVKLAFGTVFLVGALAHALSPERHEQSSLFWITLLSLMSTVNVALGLRSLARARRLVGRSWVPIAGAWGFLAVALLGLLLRR
jgi:hypothetical protein